MPRIRVFQHVPFEGIGSLQTVFEGMGAVIDTTCWFQGDAPPAPESFDFLVIMGGPMGTYDEDKHPWLVPEKKSIKEALAAGKPVLGICLGSQLLAEVLGGQVTRNPHREIGWFPVERSAGAKASRAARCFPERFQTFHWHGDTFSLPPGAVPLFHSEACVNQGFAWKERAVGLQFHPEITPESIADWIENGAEDLKPGPYVQGPERIRGKPEDFSANNAWVAQLCRELIRDA